MSTCKYCNQSAGLFMKALDGYTANYLDELREQKKKKEK